MRNKVISAEEAIRVALFDGALIRARTEARFEVRLA